jgi:hypothetical protein
VGKARPVSKADGFFRKLPAKTWYSAAAGVCSIAAAKGHVSLGFARGRELADPEKRLEGTGKEMRHVKITNTGEIDDAVRKLLAEAFALDAG